MTRHNQIKRIVQALRQWTAILPEREKNVVQMRLGISVYDKKTLEETALEQGITLEGVRQAEIRGIKKLESFEGIDDLLKYGGQKTKDKNTE